MPIDFVMFRASSIPEIVTDQRSKIKIGITGGDILWESGMGKDYGEELPIEDLNPNAKKSSLYIGLNDEYFYSFLDSAGKYPTVASFSNCMVATKFPKIAKELFSQKETENVEIFQIPGGDEAVQYAYANCEGVLGTLGSGRTAGANQIQVLEIFYQVTTRMIENNEKLSQQDKTILNDIKERTTVALQKKRMI